MRNRIILIAVLVALTTITGCALRFSAEVKNPWHPETHPAGAAKSALTGATR